MKHPTDANLALFAGRDLQWFTRRRTARHLAVCERCRLEVSALRSTREEVAGLEEISDLPWARISAEMHANIRVGLSAGECVRRQRASIPLFSGLRGLLASGGVLALLVASFLIGQPSPAPHAAHLTAPDFPVSRLGEGTVIEATSTGIALKTDGQVLTLLNKHAKDVNYFAGAQGSMRARYVDSDTGYITINNVYVE